MALPFRAILGLGNPGDEYADTRHNAGWWLLDHLARAWDLGPFRRAGSAEVVEGAVGGCTVRLIRPLTFMNRSGGVLHPLARVPGFDPLEHLLVLVDDVALPPGRARFRPGGSAGGHNGLKSIEATLDSREYARLRIGVGQKPPGADLADWVLGPPPPEERAAIDALLPWLADGVRVWMEQGIEAAMNRGSGSG